jgi:pimeloyl-ACP methyl ester carboxylesterase
MPLPFVVLILVFALILAGFLIERRAEKDAFAQINPPGQRIDVGEYRLYMLASGERRPGQPLVLLEAGHGDWSKCWANVQPEISQFARVLSYDRAGSGWSDPGPIPRTPQRMVLELHKLLEQAGESGPYLLVGHSMGAPLSRLFYQYYPSEVAGMVWVDPAHERMDRFLPFWKSALFSLLIALQAGRVVSRLGLARLVGKRILIAAYPYVLEEREQSELLAQLNGPRFFDWLYAETFGFSRASDWPEENPSLGSLPVISIEAQYSPDPPPYYTKKLWRQFLTGWHAIHDDSCRLSSCVVRVPVQTGHAVMHEAPQVVVEAVRQMLERREP